MIKQDLGHRLAVWYVRGTDNRPQHPLAAPRRQFIARSGQLWPPAREPALAHCLQEVWNIRLDDLDALAVAVAQLLVGRLRDQGEACG